MAETLVVKPAPGRRVRDPRTKQPLPETGAEVPDSVYWRRRLADGDVVRIAPAAPAPAAATAGRSKP